MFNNFVYYGLWWRGDSDGIVIIRKISFREMDGQCSVFVVVVVEIIPRRLGGNEIENMELYYCYCARKRL